MLIAARAKCIPHLPNCDVIGIDRGAYLAIQAGFTLTCAIGDFDSVNETELMQIQAHCPLFQLPTKPIVKKGSNTHWIKGIATSYYMAV